MRFKLLIFFAIAVSFFSFDAKKAFADQCTNTFTDGSYSCIDINDANATKNIFDTDVACQTGYCAGAANIQCCRTTCNETEECKDLTVKDGKTFSPTGYTCTDRGVCSSGRACCKPSSTGSGSGSGASGSGSGGSGSAGAGGSSSSGSTCGAGEVCFTNPLKFNTVEGFLSNFLGAMQKIIVTLALVMIVLGAVMYVLSGANPDLAKQGKNAITMALIGLAIGIAAPSILKELAGILGWGTTENAQVNAAMTFSQIALRLLRFLLGILGTLAVVMTVIGGTMYLTSAGDEDRIKTGKNIFKYSIIGVVISLSAMIIVRQIAAFFAIQ